ncbi:MAG: hypothetical protein KatS3mg008_0923 [Acidimicrobiales bacterium]|nr:MAG: hypothetical protein KatS3mg008_0923 [Acidimicrobiales bacterium]
MATVSALASAALHAGWNLAVKRREERDLALWGQFSAAALLCAPLVALSGVATASLPQVLTSTAAHVAYVSSLRNAYDHGEFSFSYPVARGTGALVAALLGAFVLHDRLSALSWAGVITAVAGLAGVALSSDRRRLRTKGRLGHDLSWSLVTGGLIGVYTVIDASGARVAGAWKYGTTLFVCQGLALLTIGLVSEKTAAFRSSLRAGWAGHLAAGTALVGAYLLVLVAVEKAPVGYVAVLRESSVVMGAAAGWMVLGEKSGAERIVASAVILVGLALLVTGAG